MHSGQTGLDAVSNTVWAKKLLRFVASTIDKMKGLYTKIKNTGSAGEKCGQD